MSTVQFLFSGFGGQGILFAGKFLAYKGLTDGKQVSWLPSYGPEMRGGTASCGVILSDGTIGSPIVAKPDILVAMNLPSLDRYEDSVVPGGVIFMDSSLIGREVKRTDVRVVAVPSTRMAEEEHIPTLSNMILMGKILDELGEFNPDGVLDALKKVVSAKHADLLEVNLRAMQMGADFGKSV